MISVRAIVKTNHILLQQDFFDEKKKNSSPNVLTYYSLSKLSGKGKVNAAFGLLTKIIDTECFFPFLRGFFSDSLCGID